MCSREGLPTSFAEASAAATPMLGWRPTASPLDDDLAQALADIATLAARAADASAVQ